MPEKPAPDTDSVCQALDRFVQELAPRALRHADMATGSRARAMDLVGQAMAAFAREGRQAPQDRWPVLFWRSLGRRIAGATGDARTDAAAVPGHRGDDRSGDPDPPVRPADWWALASLRASLRALPQDQRGTFLLRVCEGMDITRTAQAMELSEAGAKAALFHALQALRASEIAQSDADTTHAWVLRARSLLQADARNLDARTGSQLAHARAEALAALRQRPRRGPGLRLLAGAAVLAGIAVVALQQAPRERSAAADAGRGAPVASMRAPAAPPLSPAHRAIAAPDYGLLAEVPDTGLLEDLEFYVWLSERQDPDG